MTNREKIMQMSDAEFAKNILLNNYYFTCSKCPYDAHCKGKKCADAIVEWLQTEVETSE